MESIDSKDPSSKSESPWAAALDVAAISDTGMRRRNNQDSYSIVLAEGPSNWEKTGHLFVVADGMGAHAAGELASRLAADLIPHHYQKHNKSLPAEALVRSVNDTNAEIYRRGQANPEFRNMGTTASILSLLPEGAVVAHVGDSRVYRLRGQQLDQLTFDHSLVWEMQASGEVNEETIRSGVIPKNVITRSLGPNPSVQVDLEGPFPVRKGDRFLLCSDGLSGQISDEEIGVLIQTFDAKQAAQLMVDLANLRGGPDNITAIVVGIRGTELETPQGSPSLDDSKRGIGRSGISAALAIVAAICFLTAAVLLFLGKWPLAIIIGVLGGIAVITGLVQRSPENASPEMQGEFYGKGPHRRFSCKPDHKLVDQLLGMIHALHEAADENGWKIDWETVEPLMKQGGATPKGKEQSEAIKNYGLALLEIMKMMRAQRGQSDPSRS